MLRTIRARIAVLATVLVAVLLCAAAVAVVVVVRAELEANLDRSLRARADQIEALVVDDRPAAVANTDDEDRFVQVLDGAGAVVVASANLAGLPAVVDPPGAATSFSTRADLPLEDDRYRVLVRRIEGPAGTGYVVVGENVDDVRDGVRALVLTLLVVVPLATAALAAMVWWLVGRALRPVERVRREVAEIGLDELDRRVPVPGTADEIDRLAGTMNEMLARLEASVDAQRRFVGDVSHELRTPLTRLRTSLEVDLARPDADLRAVGEGALDDAVAMQAIVDDLLFLARRDAGHVSPARRLVDLDAVIADEVADLAGQADGVAVDGSGVAAAQVLGDQSELARLVRNLLSNALRHARTGVVVDLRHVDGRVELSVVDDGVGIPAADRLRIFDRFVRLDEARSEGLGGTGLGLAIARDIARSHGGDLVADDRTDGRSGARFVARLPAPDEAPAAVC